jgi:hypothetical protein
MTEIHLLLLLAKKDTLFNDSIKKAPPVENFHFAVRQKFYTKGAPLAVHNFFE